MLVKNLTKPALTLPIFHKQTALIDKPNLGLCWFLSFSLRCVQFEIYSKFNKALTRLPEYVIKNKGGDSDKFGDIIGSRI